MTTYEKYLGLIKMLNSSTLSRKLDWRQVGDIKDAYMTVFPESTLSIFRVFNELASGPNDPIFDYTIRIYNKDLDIVDEFSDSELSRELSTQGFNIYQDMKDLFNNVKRSASGADSVLDNILSELEK